MQALVARWNRTVKRPTQSQPDSARDPLENPVDEDSATSAEEELQWKPFESQSSAPAPSVSSVPTPPPSLTPMPPPSPLTPSPVTPPPVVSSPIAPPPVASHPVASSTSSARSRPTPKATPKPQRIQPELQAAPKVTPIQPKLSKKQRMLNAARLAGAMTTADVVEGLADASGTVTSTSDASADQSSPEVGHDPKPTDEENKFAAKKWWNFLTGGKG
jgi:hypothetical protein